MHLLHSVTRMLWKGLLLWIITVDEESWVEKPAHHLQQPTMRFYHVLAFHYKARSAHILSLSKQKLIFAGAWGCFSWNVLWQHILSNHWCWPKGVQARETRGQTVTCKSIGQWVHLLFTMGLSGSKIPGWFLRTRRRVTFGDVSPKMLKSNHEIVSDKMML